jgi:hypothetical protein
MSGAHLLHAYSVAFTNGSTGRQIPLEAFSLSEARERAANIARGIMEEHEPATKDWSEWRIIIETVDEGRSDDPFPSESITSPALRLGSDRGRT